MADAYESEMAAAVDAVMVDDPMQLADERRDMLDFNMALASIAIIIALATALSVILDAEMAEAFTERDADEQGCFFIIVH